MTQWLVGGTGDALFYSGPPRSAEELSEMLARQGVGDWWILVDKRKSFGDVEMESMS